MKHCQMFARLKVETPLFLLRRKFLRLSPTLVPFFENEGHEVKDNVRFWSDQEQRQLSLGIKLALVSSVSRMRLPKYPSDFGSFFSYS